VAEAKYAEQEHIDSPPETVFEYRLDYERTLPEYNPNVRDMKRTDGGSELGPGAEYAFAVEIPDMGTMPTSLTVLEAERPSRIVYKMGSGMIEAYEECTFTASDGGTRVTFEVTLRFPDEMGDGIVQLAERSGREQVRLELDLMKKALEG
jgi:uncharacterized protein YndB with AHSA1/START domain